ncbi:XFIN-like protein [Mya arenaria]|uniref:XFIN-like protein n=1 Tax=Mya arenaria TaxID=6604 RepID=A0ABY7EU53_MYAAR|nr:XFIN-like protein [Mya arenaria]
MSDGATKLDDDGSVQSGIKRAGRTRICKQCKYTTTDVREFSNHRLHAHADENNDESKTVTRKTNLRRKSSAASEKSIVTPTEVDFEKDLLKEDNKSTKTDFDISVEQKQTMASEQISPELLSSLALAPRKTSVNDSNNESMERATIENMNGVGEEVLMEKDDDQDDEPRLIIADASENGDIAESELNNSDGLAPSRSGNIQNRNYLCGNCDYSTTSAKTFLHHQRDVHNSGIAIYECDFCDYATKYKQKLPRHRRLHFFGKDGLQESDLESSLTDRELREHMNNTSVNMELLNGEEDLDDDAEMYDEDDEDMVTLSSREEQVATPGGSIVGDVKKKRIRQEVDPLKYYEVVDDVGVKYACSKCGNVYKWRKSLNKHWKEKHCGETPDLTKPPATLQNYTLYSRYKAKYGGQPPPPAAPNVVYGAAAAPPANQIKHRGTPTSSHSGSSRLDEDQLQSFQSVSSLSNVVMPRKIGPFIGGTNSNNNSMFNPAVTLASLAKGSPRTAESHHDVRHMMHESMEASREKAKLIERAREMFSQQSKSMTAGDAQQMEPLDFSKKSSDSSSKSETSARSEHSWGDNNSESDSLTEMPISMMVSQANNQIAAAMKQSQAMEVDSSVLQCGKCNFTAKTLTDYSSHMTLHLNKRAFKCAECHAHFTGIEELNQHFLDSHSEKIQEHKEAIQKIPHGLQQTYHLLRMPLDSISNLSSQELASNEPKQLKCNMCSFVAKWPAELQKHAVSHSEERPFVCMVCGSTYKWKWDLVKHFEKSHSSLPNPYKRREGGGVMAANSPATPPPDMMSTPKQEPPMMIDIAAMQAGYADNEMPPAKKRRLSESEMQQGTEHYFRELVERQMQARHELGQLELPPHLKMHMQNRGAFSDPMPKLRNEVMRDELENQTPKRNVHEALKQRLNNGNNKMDIITPSPPSSLKVEKKTDSKGNEVMLPYKCTVCEYRARWPSEISQHMKNHSNEKPFHCPRCSYKSKWKWDVVKHLRRCGGGTVHDVIDTTKVKKMAPPNVMVMPASSGHQQQSPSMNSHSMKKPSPNQPVFPTYSMNLPISLPSSVSKSLAANFSMVKNGLDNRENMDIDGNNRSAFRSLTSPSIHGCPECPFVGNSPTELKRHALLHSEAKPFSCHTCGYSTRWKCDLKKHMKNYGHANTTITLDSGDDEMENNHDEFTEMSDLDSDEDQSTLYMCPQCPYNSYKKKAYEHHLKIHGGWNSMNDDTPDKMSKQKESSSKYKCSKCSFHGNDLSSFLQHKRSHQAEENEAQDRSVTPVSDVSNRTIQLKHRRKPVKQLKCSQCPYVCFKQASLDIHDAMHIIRGSETCLCLYCTYNVFNKSLLLKHMRLHPEYNPAECSEAEGKVTAAELMEMEDLEEKEINGDDSESSDENNFGDSQNEDDILDFSANASRTSTPVSLPNGSGNGKQQPSPTNNNSILSNMNNNEKTSPSSGMNLPCEWCSATFPNVVALYHHSQSLHPNQLQAQEAGDVAARQAPSKESPLEQIVRERQREYQVYHQFMARQQPQIALQIQSQLQSGAQGSSDLLRKLVPLAPKPQTSTTQSPGGQTQPLDVNIPMDVSSQDRLNLLYQHMKGTHPSKWSGTTEEKISLSVNAEDGNNNFIEEAEDNAAEDPDADASAEYLNGREAAITEGGALFDFQTQGLKPTLVLLDETTWRGVQIQVCSLDGRRHFKCLKCMYINSNAANTANHSQQHGLNRKFKCHQCDYSVDNPKHMQHHLESIHPREPNFSMVNPQRNTVLVDDFPEEINNKSESGKTSTKQSIETSPYPLHSCPKCPYKTTENAKLQIHIERHSGQGRYECQLCDYAVDEYSHLRHHARLHNKLLLSPGQLVDSSHSGSMYSYEDQEFAKRWSANNPIEKASRNEVCFKCRRCPYFTTKKAAILKHRLHHINKGPFACQKCSFSTNLTIQLEEHVKCHENIQQPQPGNSIEFLLDPFSEMYKVLEKFPDDLDAPEFEGEDNMDEMEELMDDESLEDDVEAAMMEEELRETIRSDGDVRSGVERNLNNDGSFDNELQFRNYKCQDCPYSSNSNSEYTKHLRLHGGDKKFKCDYCTYSLDRVNLISQHRKLHFQEKDFETAPLMSKLLNNCHEEFTAMFAKVGNEIAYPPAESNSKVDDNLDLYMYQKLGDEKNRYACNKCPYRCQALKSFKCHMQMHGLNRKYRCDYCDWSAERLNLMIQHRRVHSGEKGFHATLGEINFLNREFVLEGDSNAESVVGVALADYPEAPVMMCDPKSSPKKNELGQKIYYCKLCPFNSENLNTFSYHKRLHCLQAKYSCSECSFSIDNITSLKEHISLHKKERELILASINEGGNKLRCPKCPYNTSNKNLLVSHTAMHASGRKHECSECDFSTDNSALLTLHLKVHKGGYSEKDSLEEVELLMKQGPDVIGPQFYLSSAGSLDLDSECSNSSDPDHKCDKCPYSTPSKDELGSHNLGHDSSSKHSCMYCTFSCAKDDDLLTHVQVHFPCTAVDKELLRSLKRQSYKRNIMKELSNNDDKTNKSENIGDEEPDSTTVNETLSTEVENVGEVVKTTEGRDIEKTKVYVCQYCEREYDDKASMLQHEKHHLVGSKF